MSETIYLWCSAQNYRGHLAVAKRLPSGKLEATVFDPLAVELDVAYLLKLDSKQTRTVDQAIELSTAAIDAAIDEILENWEDPPEFLVTAGAIAPYE